MLKHVRLVATVPVDLHVQSNKYEFQTKLFKMLFTTGSKSYFTIYYIHKDFTIECNTDIKL